MKQGEFLTTWMTSRPVLDMMCITPHYVFLIAENTFRDLGFFVAGDFGVATIMDDARTRTRTTVGTMNWMAPEVLERPYPPIYPHVCPPIYPQALFYNSRTFDSSFAGCVHSLKDSDFCFSFFEDLKILEFRLWSLEIAQ